MADRTSTYEYDANKLARLPEAEEASVQRMIAECLRPIEWIPSFDQGYGHKAQPGELTGPELSKVADCHRRTLADVPKSVLDKSYKAAVNTAVSNQIETNAGLGIKSAVFDFSKVNKFPQAKRYVEEMLRDRKIDFQENGDKITTQF